MSTDCWLWPRSLDSYGYGYSRRSFANRAHQASYLAFNGDIPDGLVVCHSCDTPACVNPEHLFLDTNEGNQRDKLSKDRQAREMGHGARKINPDAVRDIRSGPWSPSRGRELSLKYGVTVTLIRSVWKGKLWKRVV